MLKPLVIFGAGELAEQVHYYLTEYGGRQVDAFVVDAAFLRHEHLAGLPVVALEDAGGRFDPASHDMFVAVGYSHFNQHRKRAFLAMQARGYGLPSFIHPRAYVARNVTVGPNTLVHEMAAIAPLARLGDNVRIGAHAVVSHHCTIGSHSYLSSSSVVCGHGDIGERCFLGANSTVRDRVRVGEGCIVGAGAYIAGDCEAGGVYPAAAASRRPPRP